MGGRSAVANRVLLQPPSNTVELIRFAKALNVELILGENIDNLSARTAH